MKKTLTAQQRLESITWIELHSRFDPDGMSDTQLVRTIKAHYDGGWDAFLNDDGMMTPDEYWHPDTQE